MIDSKPAPVGIFREQLFKLSETFITAQAQQLKAFAPVYVGREQFGAAPIDSSTIILPGQFSRLWHVAARSPKHFLKLLQDQKLQLLHAHFGVDAVYALPLASALNLPLVTTFHGFDATTSTRSLLFSHSPSWVNYAIQRRQLARQGDLFICVSEYIRQRLLELGFPEDRTFVHYIGVNTDVITPPKKQIRQATILHVGRLVEKKGTEYLIRAFAIVAQKIAEARLLLIGEGPLRSKLDKLANELGVERKIEFLGARSHSEVLAQMGRATMLVVPSITAASGDMEGLPTVAIEAGAMALPVIGSLHSGIPEAIIDGKTGFLVAERDVKALAERMWHLLTHDRERHDMSCAARALVESKFSLHKQTQQLEELYRQLL